MLFTKFSPRPLAITLALLPTAPLAHEIDDRCAVVVSSWRSLQKAHQFRTDNPELEIQRIYKTYDGWYSVATDLLDEKNADQAIRDLKSSSAIPEDSFCLDYALYLDTAWDASTTADAVTSAPADAPASIEAPVPEVAEDQASDPTPQILVEDSPAPSTEDDPEPVLTGESSLAPDDLFGTGALSPNDVRVLQAGLTYLGYYHGSLDGVWGKGTQAALDLYARSEFETAATNLVAVELLDATLNAWRQDDWRMLDLPDFDGSLQIPSRHIDAVDQLDGSLNLVSKDGTMTGRIIVTSAYVTEGLHDTVIEYQAAGGEPERVRQEGFWITAASDDVSRIYMRSFWSDALEQWVSLILTYPVERPQLAAYMIATFQQGAGDELALPDTSVLFDMAEAQGRLPDLGNETIALDGDPMAAPDLDRQVSSRASEPTSTLSSKSAPLPHGSGFFINADGAVMTSHFVANQCEALQIDGDPALLLAASDEFDLAIVRKLEASKAEDYLSFAHQAAQLDEPVTIAGYAEPSGAEGLSVADGSIFAALGRDDSWSGMQVVSKDRPSAGAPIVDSYGHVVGVVSTLFDGGIAEDALGNVHGVSYAVRGELGTVLAQLGGIDFTKAESTAETGDATDQLEKATVSISCGRDPAS